MKKTLRATLVFSFLGILFLFSFNSIKNFFFSSGPALYKEINIPELSKANFPVKQLIENLKSGRKHLLKHSFKQKNQSEKFVQDASLPLDVISQFDWNEKSSEKRGDVFHFTYSLKHPTKKNSGYLEVDFDVQYSQNVRQFFISDFSVVDHLTSNTFQDLQDGDTYIDELSPLNCIEDDKSSSVFIKLKNKDENGNITPEKVLGSVPFEFPETVPDHFYNTNGIRQIPFDIRKVGDDSYDPGFVLSGNDSEKFQMGQLFSKLVDADGILSIKNSKGDVIPYPAGFFIDRTTNRIYIISNTNIIKRFGNDETSHIFKKPIAITVIGDFVYVLDRDAQNIAVYNISSPDGIDITFSFKETTNFGIELDGASDIDGYQGTESNFLFVSNNKGRGITKITLDGKTGIRKETVPVTISKYVTPVKTQEYLPQSIGRIEVIKAGEGENEAHIMAICDGTRVLSLFLSDNPEGEFEASLNNETAFPGTSSLKGIGYNLTDKSFYITDLVGKIHIFSLLGEYLGSGGRVGSEERNEELYYPNIITSNFFADDALELVVGNSWSKTTGFKRIIPSPDLGTLKIIEQAPLNSRIQKENLLLIQYSITSGIGVKEVSVKVNGQNHVVDKSGFYSGQYVKTVDLSNANSGVASGWNEVEVSMIADVLTESNIYKEVLRSRKTSFYYEPSKVEFSDGQLPAQLQPTEENEIALYKSLYIEGKGSINFNNTKFKLAPGAVLEFDDSISVSFNGCSFYFQCGSKLKVPVIEDYPKTFTDCSFDGNGINNNMIFAYGEYTGGKGYGSAPSSMLEFINCKFSNYFGKAVHIAEGRATVVNSVFDSKDEFNSLTSTGILASPGSRIDVLGSTFLNNDIAIEGTTSQVYVGSKKKKYKGTTLTESLFSNNAVGIFNFNSSARVENSLFENNKIALVNFDGILNISKKAGNILKGNEVAIIASHPTIAERGHNIFEGNKKDILLLVTPNTPHLFEFSCNEWKSSDKSGIPVVEVIHLNETNNQEVKIDYLPTVSEKSNGKQTCTGNQKENYEFTDTDLANDNFLKNNETEKVILSSAMGLTNLNDKFNPADEISTYGVFQSPQHFYKEFLFKNTLTGILFNRDNFKNNQDYTKLKNEYNSKALTKIASIDQTLDRLEFIKVLTNFSTYFVKENENNSKRIVISIFPNPVKESSFKANVNAPEEGRYQARLFRYDGKGLNSLFDDKYLLQGDNLIEFNVPSQAKAGLYILTIQKDNYKGSTRLVIF